MELRQLRYFIKVAERLSVSEAAKDLCITQSTLSQQIRQLENELGVQLFDRTSRCVKLTEIGVEMLPYAAKTVQDAEVCVDHISDIQNLKAGVLRVGVSYSFGSMLATVLAKFMKLYPGVKLDIHYKKTDHVMERLCNRQIDLALAFKPERVYPNLESKTLFKRKLSAIVNRYHPLANKKTVSLKDLLPFDMVLVTHGMQARDLFEAILSKTDITYHVRAVLNTVPAILQLVRNSQFVTVLSEETIRGDRSLVSIPIDVQGNVMEGCVHWLRDSYVKSSAKELVRLLMEENNLHEIVNEI